MLFNGKIERILMLNIDFNILYNFKDIRSIEDIYELIQDLKTKLCPVLESNTGE